MPALGQAPARPAVERETKSDRKRRYIQMARTNSDTDRDIKVNRILRVARELFLRDGFDATSMGRIAEGAKVAPNTLYWYFDDKDALLIGVLERILNDEVREYQARRRDSLESHMNWILDVFESLDQLIVTIHARAAVSEKVRAWHERFHQLFEALIDERLASSGLDTRERGHAARFVVFAIEGLLSHPLPLKQRREFVAWLCKRGHLTGPRP